MTAASHDGLQLAATHIGHGDGGPRVLLVHATGFCKEVMLPVVHELADLVPAFEAIVPDQRAHGDSGAASRPFDWWDLGRDVLAHLTGDRRPTVGVGHSSGATAVVMAELLAPGTFSAMVLVEPITFPPPYGRLDDNELSVLARKRSRRFVDREEARTSWQAKPFFAGWDGRAFEGFLMGALRPVGTGYELKCHPEDEAEFYATAGLHQVYERLGEVDVPVTLVSGADSESHPGELMAHLASRFRDAKFVTVGDSGHLVVMERPAAIAELVAEYVGVPR